MSQEPTDQDCFGPNSEYLKLISSEGAVLVKRTDALKVSGFIRYLLENPALEPLKDDELNEIKFTQFSSKVLKKVCDFIKYKARVMKMNESLKIADFPLTVEEAAEVIYAAEYLQC